MNLHPHAVLSRILWRWYQSTFEINRKNGPKQQKR